MTYFVATIKDFFFGRTKTDSSDPVYRFFFETTSGERKKVYDKALMKAQADQEKVTRSAQAKSRA